jgi:hypothetical protein
MDPNVRQIRIATGSDERFFLEKPSLVFHKGNYKDNFNQYKYRLL